METKLREGAAKHDAEAIRRRAALNDAQPDATNSVIPIPLRHALQGV